MADNVFESSDEEEIAVRKPKPRVVHDSGSEAEEAPAPKSSKPRATRRVISDDESEDENDGAEVKEEMKEENEEGAEDNDAEDDSGEKVRDESEVGKRNVSGKNNDSGDEQVMEVNGSASESDSEEELDRKKKKRKIETELDEDDLELMEENLGLDGSQQQRQTGRLKRGRRDDSEAEDAELADELDDLGDQPRRNMSGDDMSEAEEGLFEDDLGDFVVDERGHGAGRRRSEAFDAYGADELVEIFGDEPVYDLEDEEQGYGEYEAGEEEEGGVRKAKAVTLSEVFEPEIMKRKYLTLEDTEIKLKDVPERIQLCHIGRGEASDEELAAEAKWILEHAYHGQDLPGRQGRDRKMKNHVADTIKQVLHYMRNELLEVPFIAYYRQDYYKPDLTEEDLWIIWDWDARWESLYDSRMALMKRIDEIRTLQTEKLEQGSSVLFNITDSDSTYAKRANTPEEVHDWHMFLNFKCHFELETIMARYDKKLQPPRRDQYTIASENGLLALTDRFLLPARSFGENLRAEDVGYEAINKPPNCEEEPDDLAGQYICMAFPDKDRVIQGCVALGVREYVADPVVRKFIRKWYYEKCLVYIRPTERGKQEIDAVHPYGKFKYIRAMPLEKLYGKDGLPKEDLMKALKAETEGMIKIDFRIDESSIDNLGRSELYGRKIKKHCLLHPESPNHAEKEWELVREEIVLKATKVLLVAFEKELRQQLQKDVRDAVSQRVYSKLKEKVNVLPVAHREIEEDLTKLEKDDEYDVDLDYKYKVMGLYLGSHDRPTVAALVTRLGEYTDPYLVLKNFLMRERMQDGRNDPKTMDMNKLKEYIQRHQPFAIAVGCEGLAADRAVKDLQRILEEIERESRDAPRIRVEMVNPEVARLYSASQRAKDEFPDLPATIHHAISLARRLQDPLVEFCGLADETDTLSALFMDEYQDFLGVDARRSAMQRALVEVVNNVGVKINNFKNRPNQHAVMQFCCGFGPRKASQFLEQFDTGVGLMVNRKELVDKLSLGAKILVNSCGFICVRVPVTADLYESEYDPDPRDRTRIHFESYSIARTIARDALDDEGEICSCTNKKCKMDHDAGALVQRVMDRAEELDILDLNIFANMLESSGLGKKQLTLLNIKEELQNPFKDPRKRSDMDSSERFALLTGETDLTLFRGAKVFVRVQRVQRNQDGYCTGVAVRLESDVPGFIPISELSDHRVLEEEVEQTYQQNEIFEARVMDVDKSRMSVKLSTRPTVLADDMMFLAQADRDYDNKDRNAFKGFYDQIAATDDIEADQAKIKKRMQKRQVPTRGIQHPNFKNVSAEEAEAMLATMDRGEAIIRPSTTSFSQLSLTWKVWDGVYCHETIKEEGRQEGYQIGSRLIIENEAYDDLDEIIARRVQAMASLLEEVVENKCFKPPMTQPELVQALAVDKASNPQRIPYYLSIDSAAPGRLKLAYQPKEKPIIESVKITPKGFRYRGQVHANLTALINWFKRNFSKPVQRPQQHSYMSHQQYDQYHAPAYSNQGHVSGYGSGHQGHHRSHDGGHYDGHERSSSHRSGSRWQR